MIRWWKNYWDGTSQKLTWWQQIVIMPILIVGNLFFGLLVFVSAVALVGTWMWMAYCWIHLLRGS